ncbi:MAG: hypothetical protein IJT19_07045 [Bacteroidaceae bacterium]|nr:hypothetical protein [Bacteroidaceae bacterium]
MKKNYLKPTMRVVLLLHQQPLLQASVNNVSSSTGLGFGGGGSGPARARQNNDDWGDWDE